MPTLPYTVAMFTYSTLPRGSVVHAAYVAEALHAAGVPTTLYALDKEDTGFYRPLSCPHVLIRAQRARGPGAQLVAQRIAEVEQYLRMACPQHDVYHAQDCLSASGLLRWKNGGMVTRTVHHVERFADPYLARCQQNSIQRADHLLTVSAEAQREVKAHFGRDTTLVGNGVDRERFASPSPVRTQALRARLLAGASGPLLVSFGGIEERKNTLGLLDAFAELHRSFPEARWAIAGGASVLDHGRYQQRFHMRRAELAVGDAIVELGVIPESDVAALLACADVFACPSLLEGFGLTVLEALAAGTPAVVSRCQPFLEVIPAAAVEWADPLAPTSIAAALLRALHPNPTRHRAGVQAASTMSWARVAERYADAFTDHLGKSARYDFAQTSRLDSPAQQELSHA